MRKPLIAGNWKMHGSSSQIRTLVEGIKRGATNLSTIDILICPTFVHLIQVHHLIENTSILMGAQNVYLGEQGAYTGEISGPMLTEVGCEYVLIGHSERRSIFGEDLSVIAEKFKAAIAANLKPVLCVGETSAQREAGETEKVVREQIESVLQTVGISAFANAVIAYEPVWAIGTGLTPTPMEAQSVHAFIRGLMTQNNVDIGSLLRILYGGSMNAKNAASLLAMPDIDGGLIGGASLDAASFLAICETANQKVLSSETAKLG